MAYSFTRVVTDTTASRSSMASSLALVVDVDGSLVACGVPKSWMALTTLLRFVLV